MSLRIAKDNTTPYDYYSDGDGSDPISVAATLDGSGSPATITVSPITDMFLVAEDETGNIGTYTNISIALVNEETGINWEVSANGVDSWGESISPADMDVSATDKTLKIYLRAVINNDGSVLTANYAVPDLKITATENPN